MTLRAQGSAFSRSPGVHPAIDRAYESTGIDLEPLKHINPRTFNKERKGELAEEGPVLARRQWDAVHDRLLPGEGTGSG